MALKPVKASSSSISSIENLSVALGVPISDIRVVEEMTPDERYACKTVPKSAGKSRVVYNPCAEVRKLQQRVNTRIFKKLVVWPDYIFGSLPNDVDDAGSVIHRRDYVACAQSHCEAKSLIKFDISNFFESIHRDHVHAIFTDFFHYPVSVSDCLTNICCYEDKLIQGALTSSYLAALCLWDVEWQLVENLRRRRLIYTRLVDDITISSKVRNYDFRNPESYLREMLLRKDLPFNETKFQILRSGSSPLLVHGLRVEFSKVRLPASEISKIRAAVNNVVVMASSGNYRTSNSYRKQYDRCLGRVTKLSRVGHSKYDVFLKKLRNVPPLPSNRDLEKVRRAIIRMKKTPKERRSLHSYKRLYGITMYRIGIIGRTYKKEKDCFLAEMEALRLDFT